jgi:flagellar protein FliO/FliZ
LNVTDKRCAARRVLYALSATPFAAPVQQAVPGSTGGLLRVVVALIVVLAAVLAAAWLARRMRAISSGGSAANLEVLAQLSLGARERAVLVRVGNSQVLIGVAPGNVRMLHVLPSVPPASATSTTDANPTPADALLAASASVARPTFKALLLRSLGK